MTNVFFQQHISDLIRRVIESEETQTLTQAQITLISAEISSFINALLGAILLFMLVLIVGYFLLSRRKNVRKTTNYEPEQQQFLMALENQTLQLMQLPVVRLAAQATAEPNTLYQLSAALTPDTPWLVPKKFEYSWPAGEQYVIYSESGDLIATRALNVSLYWFRRLHRANSSGVMPDADLFLFWREILPFVTHHRYQFLTSYCAGENAAQAVDMEAVQAVAVTVIRHAQQHKITEPLTFLKGRIDSAFHDSLPKTLKSVLDDTRPKVSPSLTTPRKEPTLDDMRITIED